MTNIFLLNRSRLEDSFFVKIISIVLISFFIFSPFLASAQALSDSSSGDVSTPATTSEAPIEATLEENIQPIFTFPESKSVAQKESFQNETNIDETSLDSQTPFDPSKDQIEQDKIEELPQMESLLSVDSNKWLNSYSDNLHLPDTSHVSGAFTYNVDIHTPPGRNGIEPNLKLQYNSQDRDPENQFGTGWTLNIPYIEQINKQGVEDLYSGSVSRYYTSSLDGELATTTGTDYMAKSDSGSFHKYSFSYGSSAGWTMTDKNGTRYTFGTTTANQLSDPSDSTRMYRWMLDEVRDVNGNSVIYQYTKDNGQIYPSKIIYTYSATTSPAFEISFLTETRTDSPFSYKYGFKVSTLKRVYEINVKKNGTLIHKFEFDYTTGDNTVKSLLSSITETGFDESNSSTTIPAITFAYQTRDQTWSSSVPSPFNLPELTDSSGADNGYRIFNYQRDGKTQFILLKDTVSPVGYNPTDWSSVTVDSGAPKVVDSSNLDKGAWFADVNGDLFPDIVLGKLGSYQQTYLWTNGGTFASTTLSNSPNIISSDGNDRGARFGDLNGDGYADYVLARDGLSQLSYLNLATGAGWDAGDSSNLGYYFAGSTGYDYGSRIGDLNGDGLDDVIRRRPGDSGAVILINKGYGRSWEETVVSSSDPNVAPNITETSGKDIGTRMADINGDGLIDFIVSTPSRGIHFYVNMGDGLHWKDSATSSIPYFLNSSDEDIGTRLMVGNFDGIPDFVTSSALASEANYLSTGKPVDVLKTITLSQGGTIDITYEGTVVDSVVFQTVDTTTRNPQISGQPTVVDSYTFSAGEFKTDYQNRRFRGFGIVDQVDNLGNSTKTYYHQGNGNNTSGTNQPYDSYALGEYNDTDAKMYQPYRIEKKTSGNSYFDSVEINKLDTKSVSTNVSLVYKKDSLKLDYDGNSTHRDTAVSVDVATTTGNVIQKIEWGEVTGSTDGTFSDTLSDKRITDISYATSSSFSVIGLPSVATTTDQSSNVISATRHYYDSSALGNVQKGLETKTEFWKSGNSYASTTKSYNVYGLLATSTDALSNSTGYIYDSLFLYPATTTNALSQSTGTVYNYDYGKVKYVFDPNSRVYQTTYDGLGRVTETKQPDLSNPTTLVTKTQYTYTDNTVPTKIQETNNLSSATSTNKYTYFDGFNKKIQERIEAEGDNTYVLKDYVYSNIGNLAKESLPYFASSTSWSSPTATASLFNYYNYDSLNRIISIVNAVGTTTNSYDNWRVITTDPLGNPKDFYKDAYGNLINVVEHNNGVHATTTYVYDLNQKLTSITDGANNVRNFTYDGLGRRLTAQDLHASGDGTYGSYTYTYDDYGNMTQKVDPKSQTVNYTYDALNRRLTEDYTGSAGTEVTYTYDVGTDGIGRLTTASSTDAKITNSYNPLGGIKFSTTTISGVGYQTEYDYDRLGNHVYITYPDGSKVRYWHNSAGLLESVTQRENGGSYNTIVSNYDYSPTGKVTVKDLGNGVQTIYTYNPNALYRLTNILTLAGGTGGSMEDLILDSSSTTDESLIETSTTTDETIIPDENPFIEEETLTTEISTTSPSEATTNDSEIATSTETIITTNDDQVSDSETPSELTVQEVINEQPQEIDSVVSERENSKTTISKIEPRVTLEKWGGEVKLGVTYTGIFSTTVGSVDETSKNTEWIDGEQKLEALPLKPADGMEDGGIKINVVLNSKPSTNIFSFQLDGVQNLDFLYQDALWREDGLEAPTENCSETDCIKKNGRHYFRPENIVGSYAVYYKDKAGYLRGSTDYKTGKAFHVYRPLIIDNDGNKVWADMTYTEGVLSVVVPQEFLDTASYPVIVDPTFGYTSVGASTNDFGGNVLYAKANSTPASNGSLTSMSIYGEINSGSPNFNPALYTNSGNAPDSRLAYVSSGGTAYPGSPGWISTNISYGSITSGTQYWFGFLSNNVGALVNYDSGGSGTLHYGFGNSWDNPADDVGDEGGIYSIYATYTLSNSSPTEPTDMLTEGQTNPTNVTDSTPEFSAIYNDTDTADVAISYQIQVSTSTSFTTNLWDSGKTALASSTPKSTRIADISYSGSSLTDSTTYYWRIKFWDTADSAGAWSTATSSFVYSNSQAFIEVIQNISYTYDANGNITQITDTSDTGLAKTIAYTYDSLNRLTLASTTSATSTPYRYQWTYDVLGNITAQNNGTATTTYTYAGTGYANPHAVTTMGVATSTYDANGNITQVLGGGSSGWYQTWGYRKSITIDHTKVSGTSTLTNFPILFSATDADLKHTSFGGKMGKTDGTDIVFTSSDGTTKLDHEIEKYASTTGETINWVRIPSLSTTTDTVIYVYFGNAGASDQSNRTGVWDSNYKAVYHLADGANQLIDSTSNANNLTAQGGVSATTGKMDGAVDFDGVNGTALKRTSSLTGIPATDATQTIETWFSLASTGGTYSGVTLINNNNGNANQFTHDSGAVGFTQFGGANIVSTHTAPTVNTWHQSVFTTTGTNHIFYYDGDSFSTGTASLQSGTPDEIYLSTFSGSFEAWDGALDEVRISNVDRSADWLKTGYNNQSATSTFYTTGSLETTSGGSNMYTWDYSNRLLEIGTGLATSTYGYDDQGQRVKMVTISGTVYYPNRLYNISTSTTATKEVFANGELISTITGTSTEAEIKFVHNDHLSGTNNVTDSTGLILQSIDYYPYGSRRINSGTDVSQREYIGEIFDESSNLSYLNARYYDGSRGQFISQDPVFWEEQNLTDPQSMNSYLYANGNPIVMRDPSGKCAEPASAAVCIMTAYAVTSLLINAYDTYLTNIKYPEVFTEEEKYDSKFQLGLDIFLLGVGGTALRIGEKTLSTTIDVLTTSMDVVDSYAGKQIYKTANESNSSVPLINSDNTRLSNATIPHLVNDLIGGLDRLNKSLSQYVNNLSENKIKSN